MVIYDKQVDNYKLFTDQEEINRILRDVRYDLDDIVVKLNRVERFVVSDSETNSNNHHNKVVVIDVPLLNMVNANSSPHSPIIILDE